ncbi:hypothetical protein C9374_008293 [Naegleria lovaniensis]|uniref:Uncharacterized protein n=1 Tax=Naegleria lovaniensis TaxID=51637 RepID=A0AA88GFX8_NAELO|nr:uncharacterized protein C9374_008293 [Naegleria lovaniensis]KAG2378654.1 hypothetical protein C9374_008293 [Naegleria lovaniensis]
MFPSNQDDTNNENKVNQSFGIQHELGMKNWNFLSGEPSSTTLPLQSSGLPSPSHWDEQLLQRRRDDHTRKPKTDTSQMTFSEIYMFHMEKEKREAEEPLFPIEENPYYGPLASKFLILQQVESQSNRFETSELEELALEIVKLNSLLKLRMDTARERREKSRRRSLQQYLLFSKMDVYLMDVCVWLYDVLKKHQFEQQLQHSKKLLEHVRNGMIHVFFNLGELCYFIWEEKKSALCMKQCMTLLNQKKEEASGVLSDQDLALLVECLIYCMIDTINHDKYATSSSDLEMKFVKPMQECLSQCCQVENMDELMTSKTTQCDMPTIAKCILRTRVNGMESLIHYKYGSSNGMEKIVTQAIQFVETQSSFDRSLLELQQYLNIDEFYCRLGALGTARRQLLEAVKNYNHALNIRRKFYIRTLINKNIAIHNLSSDSTLLKILTVYYNLLSQWECSKFKKITEKHWKVQPFCFLQNNMRNCNFETIFGEDDPTSIIQQQDLEEHTIPKWLLNIENVLNERKDQESTYKELIEDELKWIAKFHEMAQEELYLKLSIPKLDRFHYVDVEITTTIAK